MNFQAMLLQPNKKNMKKLREVLYDLYKHLDSSAAAIIDVSLLLALGCVFVLCGLNIRNYFMFCGIYSILGNSCISKVKIPLVISILKLMNSDNISETIGGGPPSL